ncbi:MAG: hypothetical protein EOO38_04895 [Cytophagaceae bacterium]|nr:MAG: hypothetical protein EOO38_04895 [Cytophagaceae bacterium]
MDLLPLADLPHPLAKGGIYMVINLEQPFSLGDLSPISFPHVYISRLIIDGPSQTVSVQYEMGVMSPDNVWTPTPVPTMATINMFGAALYPFFFTKPNTLDTSLWDQVEALVYGEIQTQLPRLAGVIGNPTSPAVEEQKQEPTETTPVTETLAPAPEIEPAAEAVPDANI